jgi:hypothetical protein
VQKEIKNRISKLERVPINIWDDYYEDGYVPEGKIQKTYIYVENYEMSEDMCKHCLEILLQHIQKITSTDVKTWIEYYDSKLKYPNLIGTEHESMLFTRWEIKMENLSHKDRHKLVDQLNDLQLTYEGVPIEIYSES